MRRKPIKAPLAIANLLWDKSGELIKPKKERKSLGKKIKKATAKEIRKRHNSAKKIKSRRKRGGKRGGILKLCKY